MGRVTAPEPLGENHHVDTFDCAIPTLNEWLTKRARRNESGGGSRTFVICDEQRVIGYYALATGSVERNVAPKSVSRNMPEPIPVVVLGRLAIDQSYQSQGLGSALLKDALVRTIGVSRQVGIRAILVHAISVDAKKFYQHFGFIESPVDEMTLMLAMKHINAAL